MTEEKKIDHTNHTPRPITPEDESYGDLMLRFTAHPVKPKYWFEEFGDHWSCSCGQINKGEVCTNCGLERNLLRKLFILHKPSAEGSDGAEPAVLPPDHASGEDPGFMEEEERPHSHLVAGIIVLLVLLLLGSGALLYFVVLPEMAEQDQARADAVRNNLAVSLPQYLSPLPEIQYNAYCEAGDALCDEGNFNDSLSCYNKAAALKDNEEIQQKILDAKFGYVNVRRKKGEGQHFVQYLTELHEKDYDGIQSIYDDYYAWNVKIIANNLPEDYNTDMETLNRNDIVYFHVTLTGGPPDGSIRFYYEATWPNGTKDTGEIDSTWSSGSQFSTRFQYSVPIFSKEGTLTFNLYSSDSHDKMGSDSVQLKK